MKQKNLSSQWRHGMNRTISLFVLIAFVFSVFWNNKILMKVKAAAPGTVVINEVAWAGSADSSYDEWIELYNNSSQPVDLSNWYIEDDGSTHYTIVNGSIPAHSYFLIEDHESSITTTSADAIINISLTNTGDSLKLYDNSGQLIDTVNSSSAVWAAGSATTKATMERLDASISGDQPSNWATSTGTGEKASGGSNIIGTPKKLNSTNIGQIQGQKIEISLNPTNPKIGDTLNVLVKAQNVTDLFAYGFDLSYDPAILEYKNASKQSFLSENGAVQTSFQSGLENTNPGKLVMAEARTNAIKTGISGNGDLVNIEFQVKANTTNPTQLHFENNSFLADITGDTTAQFVDKTFSTQTIIQINPITNLQITEGVDRYSLYLSWTASTNANLYRIFRKDPHDQWQLLQEMTTTNFTDKDGVTHGGSIIPEHTYQYRIVAVNGPDEAVGIEGSQMDSRGIKGDNNRSDRTDGQDLVKLARYFGQTDQDISFDHLTDTTYDGVIDGNDLIDLGATFASNYTP